MKHSKGSALLDYVLPTALIGIVAGFGLYLMVSNGSIVNFFSASVEGSTNSSRAEISVNDTNSVTGGELGGTPAAPKTKCSFGNCSIDFGDYALSGVPEDFNEYVESSSSSGGTGSLANYLEQMIEQMDPDTEADKIQDFKDLANLVNMVSAIQSETEAAAKDCVNDANPAACYKNYFDSLSPFSIPFGSNILDAVSDGVTSEEAKGYLSILSQQTLSSGASQKYSGPMRDPWGNPIPDTEGGTYSFQKEEQPTYKMLDILDKIKDPANGYTDFEKNMVSTILTKTDQISISLLNNHKALNTGAEGVTKSTKQYDIHTGAETGTITNTNVKITDLINPPDSGNLDLQVALLCASQKNFEDAKVCY